MLSKNLDHELELGAELKPFRIVKTHIKTVQVFQKLYHEKITKHYELFLLVVLKNTKFAQPTLLARLRVCCHTQKRTVTNIQFIHQERI